MSLMPVSEALSRILALISPVGHEIIPITAAGGRILAEPVIARRTQPPFPASSMDGYALRASEAESGATSRVIGESAAGHPFDGTVEPGQCVRIFTGAPVPEPLDRIIIQEDVTRDGDQITLNADRNGPPQAAHRSARDRR